MAATRITVRPNGSYRVEGEFEVVDGQGRQFGLGGRTSIALCRCGHSNNKPFCDGTHRTVGFQSVEEARDLPAPSPAATPETK